MNPERSAWRALQRQRRSLGILNAVQHLLGSLEEDFSGLGQSEMSGAAIDQLHPELSLELADIACSADHHFNHYSLCPSPLMMVAHCAGLTKRIRLGTAVCVLPLYHPARLLGEIGFADTVSGGRLDLGIGSGYQQFEFDRFGVDLKNSHSLFAELYDVLEAGMKEHVFSYSGQHLQIPPTSIAVRTVQKPMPPIWVTSGHAETLGRAVR